MLPFTLGYGPGGIKNILCLGSHCDDIEIGCGGTILRLIDEHPDAGIHWVVFSSDPQRGVEARQCANEFLAKVRTKHVVVKDFRNGFFPYLGAGIKEYFEQLKQDVTPDIIFTHYRHDLHQDHRIISDLTWNTFRNHLILEYEIPKYDGDMGTPNVFVPLPDMLCRRKIDTIMKCFESQRTKSWFTPETFSALLRLRGVESSSPSGYAEAFHCRKAIF